MTSKTRTLAVGAVAVLLVLLLTARLWRDEQEADKKYDVESGERASVKGETPALPESLSLDLGGGVKLDLLLIQRGEFEMGDGEIFCAKPAHHVRITRPFFVGAYEVTQAQYEKILGRNPSKFKGAELPVQQVSWDDARAFCQALEKTLAQPPNSDALRGVVAPVDAAKWTVDLPTEAQWEYACRAGATTPYNSGTTEKDLGLAAWYWANSDGKPHPVGQKAPNAWGLYDMHGNVWEWCADYYDENYYGASPRDDPSGPAKGNASADRVLRGGSWFLVPGDCRSAFRQSGFPSLRFSGIGFRVALCPPWPRGGGAIAPR